MLRIFSLWRMPRFLASPANTLYEEMPRSAGRQGRRQASNLVPAYPIYGAVEDPPPPPPRPIPTDGPVKQPIDIPAQDPRDVPPAPQPERPQHTPAHEPHDRPPDPRPRPIP